MRVNKWWKIFLKKTLKFFQSYFQNVNVFFFSHGSFLYHYISENNIIYLCITGWFIYNTHGFVCRGGGAGADFQNRILKKIFLHILIIQCMKLYKWGFNRWIEREMILRSKKRYWLESIKKKLKSCTPPLSKSSKFRALSRGVETFVYISGNLP